jgi:hypothetical protein
VELSEYTVRALTAILVRFRDGMPPLTQHDLDERYGAATAEAIRDGLVASELVLQTDRGFVPSRDLSRISARDVIDGIWTGAGDDPASRALMGALDGDPDRPVVEVLAGYFR